MVFYPLHNNVSKTINSINLQQMSEATITTTTMTQRTSY